ncbi:hypothetical protein F7U66_18710 [Vibrio parahaemolyticus]|nr:hypothetical protein [Vibrio parahaemolyticus]
MGEKVLLVYKGKQGYGGIWVELENCDSYDFPHHLGNYVYEPEDVGQFFEYLYSMASGVSFRQCKLKKLSSTPCFESIESCVRNAVKGRGVSQALFYVYDQFEWREGLFGEGEDFNYSSLPDYYGTSCSEKKKLDRPDIDALVGFISAPSKLLDHSTTYALLTTVDYRKTYEDNIAIKSLCDWWNDNAKPEFQCAANFALYLWDKENKIWLAGDYEEPVRSMESMNEMPCKAMFDYKGEVVLAVFLKSDEDAEIVDPGQWPTNYRVDGECWSKCGTEIADLQTSQIAMRSLQYIPMLLNELSAR